MAEAAITLVLDSLRELVSEHMDVIRSVEGELKQLEGQLQKLRAILQEQQKKGEAWRRLEREIRDLVYHTEDVIDTILTRAVTVKFNNGNFKPCHFWPSFLRLNCYGLTFTESDGLRSVIDGVRNVLEQAAAPSAQVQEIEQKRNSSLKEIKVVGFEDELANLLGYLNVEPEEFDVISIVGAPGIGKTTLASMIYGNPTIKSRFPTLVWVTVSQEFSTKDLFASVFPDEKTMPPLTDSMLADIVRHRLDNSTFLIVVDGVHTIDDWRAIEIALPKTNRFGKVLLTTHDEKLARQANPKRDPHMLRSLNFNESSELLKSNIFEMSYNKLPNHLRDCFLYMGMFPEETKIPAWKLIRLWIAEGFIQINPRKSLEEVAESHLKDLIDRNLVIVDETKVEGGIKTCHLPSMIREFCKRQAEFEVPNMLFEEFHLGEFKINDRCRRLCVHSDHVVDFLRRNPHGEVVRSFLCFSKESTNLPAECTQSIPEAFKLLRVLDASPIKFLKFSRKLARLVHLRYIAISCDGFNSLPKAVSNFRNLQTIVINTALPTLKIKASVWKAMRVRHLKTKAAIVINKAAEGRAAENLQTLSRLAAKCVTEDFCRKAFNLKKLVIRGQLKNLLEKNCLSRLDRLRKLKLVHDVNPREASEDTLIRLPPREAFPPNLLILEMSSTFLEWNQMATLGMLPILEVLKLKEHAFVGKEWNAVGGGFRYLETLLIATSDIEVWTVSGDPFPALRILVIKDCDKLTEIPAELLKYMPADDSMNANVPLAARIMGQDEDTESVTSMVKDISPSLISIRGMVDPDADVPLATRDGEDADTESVTSMVKDISPSLISIRGMVDPDADVPLATRDGEDADTESVTSMVKDISPSLISIRGMVDRDADVPLATRDGEDADTESVTSMVKDISPSLISIRGMVDPDADVPLATRDGEDADTESVTSMVKDISPSLISIRGMVDPDADVPLATRDGEDADTESVTSMVKDISPSLISIRGMVDPDADVPLASCEDADTESVTSMVKEYYSLSLISIRGMVDPDANELLETLRDLLIEKVKNFSDVDHDVKEEVEENLRTIHGFFMEADNNRGRSDLPDLKNCIAKLRDLVHEAENVLDQYAYYVGNVAHHIRSRLDHLTNRLIFIFGEEKRLPNLLHQERLRCVNDVQQHFVGRENDIDYLVSMVMDDSFHAPQFISICGMAGLGKTTLARKIYHHKDVQGHFDELAWVSATQLHAKNILREIIEKLDVQISDTRFDALVKGLYSISGRGRYFIVIDDIWEDDHLDIIRPAFPKNCKVLLTTRSEKIASHECHVHNLGLLSEDEGWELIAKLSFQINDDETQVLEKIPGSFEDIGRHLVWKCSYLPLAISVIGGILRQKKPMLADWMEVSINMDFYCSREREDVSNDTRVKRILDLSFDVLPYYLKRCFLYLASFPLGQDIYTEQLYLLWMAEGLISTEDKGNNRTLRDVAKRYLNELAFRSMIQVKNHSKTPYLKLESCRLHDRMHDLCSSKLEQEKFIKRVHVSKYNIPPAIEGSIHRLAINLDDDDATTLSKIYIQGHEDLRTILLLGKHEFGMRKFDFQNIVNFGNLEHLRLLYLYGAKFEDKDFRRTIDKRLRLKYLSLYRCKVRELPVGLRYLSFLEILDLRVSGDIEFELPNHIYFLKRLKHLFLPSRIKVIGEDKLQLYGLNELETLEEINSTSTYVQDVITLTSLRSLTVAIEGDMNDLSMMVDYMSSRCKLRETDLTIKHCDLRYVFDKMLRLDSLISLHIIKCEFDDTFSYYMCPNLLRLEIKYSIIEAELIEDLGMFPVLQFLLLEGIAGEEKMIFGSNSFPELKVLILAGLMNLHEWEVEIGALPKLEGLYISDCRKLEKLPNELRFIPVLQSLQCTFVSEEFKKRYSRGGENGEGEGQDYADFSHIPGLSIS